ncbi:hypothetical protein [Bradyrhizobium sp.]|uniref:hypothetical protein n=1 Tax=Bradyrhizobium sp. TaxID=376 RepID=UPI001ECA656F|nr:hypothetical protein [Bradyrhizobium sp.]MBV8923163.1 hypothetical protein [Bradyrhizobium sp.]MBV9982870.1 hypothetical protein [Bradyrhizobium sp.]
MLSDQAQRRGSQNRPRTSKDIVQLLRSVTPAEEASRCVALCISAVINAADLVDKGHVAGQRFHCVEPSLQTRDKRFALPIPGQQARGVGRLLSIVRRPSHQRDYQYAGRFQHSANRNASAQTG